MSSKHSDSKQRHVLVNQNCIALVLHRTKRDSCPVREDGLAVFADFLQQNSMCFWNACLTRSVASLEYRGYLVPSTLLISGTNFALEVVRSAWARRVLRPPKGYFIGKLGDVGTVDILPVLQTQFAPLSEALCKVVADLNGDKAMATTESIRSRLEDNFPEMQVPCEDILHKTLGGLIRERKIYHTGNGYFIVSPDTYRQRAVSPLCERQMLMTNEEAIVRLHSKNRRECSLAVQVDETDIAAAWSASSFLKARQNVSSQFTQVPSSADLQLLERSHSLRLLRVKGHPKNNVEGAVDGSFKESKKINLDDFEGDIPKSEKQSMLAKILKRMQFLTDKSAKHVAFSAQFPPPEWLENGNIQCHSVATQTAIEKMSVKPTLKHQEPAEFRIPWEDTQNNFNQKGIFHYASPNISSRRFHSESDGSSPRKNLSLPTRQNHSKYSPPHRYSHHGTFINYTKRRHRHRRSSSESPKVQKTLLNGYHSQSTSSKSNADNSDEKTYKSSSSGSPLIVPIKLKQAAKKHSSKEPEWLKVNSCQSKDNNISGQEISSIQSPTNSLDREVLKDVKNISTPHTKMATTKKGNIPVHSKISEINSANQNAPAKVNFVEEKSSETAVDQCQLNDSVCSGKAVFCNGSVPLQPETLIQPLVLKRLVDIPTQKPVKISPKEIIIDNSVSVEVKSPPPKPKANNVSTTIVTEETTVTKANGNSKVVTVTSITTSLSHGGLRDADKHSLDHDFLESDEKEKSFVNDLNIETEKGAHIIDCSSSCNIVTEVK